MRTPEHFYAHTNGGLEYIQFVYPQSRGTENNNRLFKIRESERTASAGIYQKKGIWYVKDQGSTNPPFDAIALCMDEEGLDFKDALKWLYAWKGLDNTKVAGLSAEYRKEPTDLPKEYFVCEDIAPCNLHVFAPFLTPAVAEEYNLRSMLSYQMVSYKKDANGKVIEPVTKFLNTFRATDKYSMWCFKVYNPDTENYFYKTYEPQAAKKGNRFRYYGQKPPRLIYGWQRLFDQADLEGIRLLRDQIKKHNEDSDSSTVKELRKELDELLLDKVIIASGGSDGLNLASLGYHVIWFNSETETINDYEYRQLKEICKQVYYLPDLDSTGVEVAVKLGLEHLDLKIIWLPEALLESGKKDFKDWIFENADKGEEKVKSLFSEMVWAGKDCKWWQKSKGRAGYSYKHTSLRQFLVFNGFYRYSITHKSQQKESGNSIFIKVDGHIVRVVSPADIKQFVIDWAAEKYLPIGIQDMVISSQFLGEKGLQALPEKKLNFRPGALKSQYFFFRNQIVQVRPEGISKLKSVKDVDCFVWDKKIIPHSIGTSFLDKKQFEIAQDAAGHWDITIHEKGNIFFNFLINASRIYWREELEKPFEGKSESEKEAYHAANRFNIAGPNLEADAITEQKLHLINKMFAIGYALHSFKIKARAFCLYVMDNKIPEDDSESYGRSGKSFFVDSVLRVFNKKIKDIEGRKVDPKNDKFMYDGVDEDTDFVFVDDASRRHDFNNYFSQVTGVFSVNPKTKTPFELSFDESPKIAITTNFAPLTDDTSTLGRLLFCIFSDYYHEKTADYNESRSISDDFGGIELFKDGFTEKDFSLFFAFCLQCLQWYLSLPLSIRKMEPPGKVAMQRTHLQKIGADFSEWADAYFTPERLDTYIMREDLQADYAQFKKGSRGETPHQQKKKLALYCDLQGWKLNPDKLCSSKNKIIREYTEPGTLKKTTKEHYYIQTKPLPDSSPEAIAAAQVPGTVSGEPDDDLPF